MYSCGFTVELEVWMPSSPDGGRGVCVIPGMGNEDSYTTPFPGWTASAPDEDIHI